MVAPKGKILLPPEAPGGLLDALWDLLHVDGDVEMPVVLDAIVSHAGRIGDTWDFAVVLIHSDGSVRAALRGSPVLECDGEAIGAAPCVTWREMLLTPSATILIRCEEAEGLPEFSVKDAVLQASALRLGGAGADGGARADQRGADAPEPQDAVPGAPESSGPGGTVQGDPSLPGDHDGRTIAHLPDELVEEIERWQKDGAVREQEAAPSAEVMSARCSAGHDNPTSRSECGECGKPLERPAVKIPQPALGRMVTSTGQTVVIDGPVLVGRAPVVQDGLPVRRLVAVTSRDRTISRNHVLVTIEGWSVLAQDLRTNNGTMLLREGEAPRRLSDAHPTLLRSGDALDLGDGVTLGFQDIP
ncbi:FHA domain-containing protein [Actinomyces sp. B33]|uniref:FHA domain-containing protein n=1 Tax=Actinomyces sp. B33 TaxID=2942131 RepID=UPI0023413C24|nr:FHA domain-containing protein [Actinomyces sp. B33]MDC4233621.1 FHA domain-containing protein [Actinomyces sp. B33]